jgi:hypothetical protein
MILFVCSTPLQIMNMLNLSLTDFKDEIIDVYILDHSPECYKYYCILKESKLFNNIYFLNTKDAYQVKKKNKFVNFLGSAKKAYNALNYRYLECKIPNKSAIYDTVFIAYPDLPAQIIYYYFKKNNNNIKLYLYDDGIYTYNALNKNSNPLRVLYSKKIFGSYILDDCKGIFAYNPDFVETGKHCVEKHKIQKMEKGNTKYVDIINNSLGFKEEYLEYLDNSCIFFDQPFGFDNIMEQQRKLLTLVSKSFGPNKTGVKIHPRTHDDLYADICNVIDLRLPYEVLQLNSNKEDNVLISIFSTACLFPKIIFNEEPFVILLYKLINVDNIETPNFDFALKVKDSYVQSNRFFIPDSVEELITIFEYIKKTTE